jgi:hypothetical protein
MANNNQPGTPRELIKPQNNLLDHSTTSEVESLCEGFSFSCYSGYGVTCGVFSDAGNDHDILF